MRNLSGGAILGGAIRHSQHLWRRAASPKEINLEPERVYRGFQFHFGVLNQKAFETLGVECQRHLMHRSATSDNSVPRVQARMRPARRARPQQPASALTIIIIVECVIVSYGHAAASRQY